LTAYIQISNTSISFDKSPANNYSGFIPPLETADIKLFKQILSTFKFTNQQPSRSLSPTQSAGSSATALSKITPTKTPTKVPTSTPTPSPTPATPPYLQTNNLL